MPLWADYDEMFGNNGDLYHHLQVTKAINDLLLGSPEYIFLSFVQSWDTDFIDK